MKKIIVDIILLLTISGNIQGQSTNHEEKRFISLISEYKPLRGNVKEVKRNNEQLKVLIQLEKVCHEMILSNTKENLVFFEMIELGDQISCKVRDGESKIGIFKKVEGRIDVFIFYLKKGGT